MKRIKLNSEPEALLVNRTDAANMLGLSRMTLIRMECEDGKLTPVRLRRGHNSKVYYKREQVLALIDK